MTPIRDRPPLTVPRYLLSVKYAMFIALGVAVGVSTTNSAFSHLTPGWYTPAWGLALSIAAMLALMGSIRARWEVLERWSTMVLTSLLLGFAIAPIILVLQGDFDRLAGSVVALTVAIAPAARAAQLLRRTGLKKYG